MAVAARKKAPTQPKPVATPAKARAAKDNDTAAAFPFTG